MFRVEVGGRGRKSLEWLWLAQHLSDIAGWKSGRSW